jgi:hypothetical protein
VACAIECGRKQRHDNARFCVQLSDSLQARSIKALVISALINEAKNAFFYLIELNNTSGNV